MAGTRKVCSYLAIIVARFKVQLGGGSVLVLGCGVYEHFAQGAVHWGTYAWIIGACLVIGLFLQGLEEHEKLIPRIRVPVGLHEQKRSGENWKLYYFGVQNIGGTTVANVSVGLKEISPEVADLSWLPVALHIKHDNDQPYRTQMTLNPGELQHIDLLEKADAANDMILWLAKGVNRRLPAGRYRLKIEVTGQDVPPSFARFEVWADKNGMLHCVAL